MLKAHPGIADVASQQRPLLPPPHVPETLWQIALGELKQQMTKDTFNAWLVDSRVIPGASSPAFLVVAVRNQYAYEWLTYRLQPVVVRTLTGMAGYEVAVCFIPCVPTMRRSYNNEPTRRPSTRISLPIR
jgi:chromosomal replication initiation ATPase DnaA